MFGLATASGAVTPASFSTLTRKSRVPPCTSSGGAAPCSTRTRLSGLMCTVISTRRSSTRSSAATAAASSLIPIASLSACTSAAASGSPRYRSAVSTRRACCARGWRGTFAAGRCSAPIDAAARTAAAAASATRVVGVIARVLSRATCKVLRCNVLKRATCDVPVPGAVRATCDVRRRATCDVRGVRPRATCDVLRGRDVARTSSTWHGTSARRTWHVQHVAPSTVARCT